MADNVIYDLPIARLDGNGDIYDSVIPANIPRLVNGQIDPAQLPAGSGGGGGGSSDSIMNFTWFLAGAVTVREFDPRVITPPFSRAELLGMSVVPRLAGTAGQTNFRAYVNQVSAGDLSLGTGAYAARWKTSTSGQAIFTSTPILEPNTIISTAITSIPSSGTVPNGITLTIWYRLVA